MQTLVLDGTGVTSNVWVAWRQPPVEGGQQPRPPRPAPPAGSGRPAPPSPAPPTFFMLYILVSIPVHLSFSMVNFSAIFCCIGESERDIFAALPDTSGKRKHEDLNEDYLDIIFLHDKKIHNS